ncbi:hypothetical protein AB0I56_46140, partial [Nonomuraea africana]
MFTTVSGTVVDRAETAAVALAVFVAAVVDVVVAVVSFACAERRPFFSNPVSSTAKTPSVEPIRLAAPPHPAQIDGTLAPLLEWITARLSEPVTIESMAAHAGVSTRTLTRR